MHPLHQVVRARYAGRCGYCGVSETDTGGELTVDHFIPIAEGGGEELENLVYSCFRCNQHKGARNPSGNDGPHLLHPIRDDLREHLQLESSTGYLVALTEHGQLQINLLRLNRPQLVAQRVRDGHYHALMIEARRLTRIELDHDRSLEALRKYLRELEWTLNQLEVSKREEGGA